MFPYQATLYLRSLLTTFASPKKVYPTLAGGITLTTSATSWDLGANAEIVPADTITERFRIDYASFAAPSVAQTFEIAFYKGLSGEEIEIGRLRINPGSTTSAMLNEPLFTELIEANSRISAKAATIGTTQRTIVCSIVYHIDNE